MTIYTKKNHVLNNITQQKTKKKCPRPGSQILGVARQGILRSSIPISSPSQAFR